jgi:hypothetical protein
MTGFPTTLLPTIGFQNLFNDANMTIVVVAFITISCALFLVLAKAATRQ